MPQAANDNREPSDAAAWLAQFTATTTARRDEFATRESRASWLRLVIFILAVLVWVLLAGYVLIAAGLTVVAIAAFVFSVRRHTRLRRQREYADLLVQMCEESRARLGGAVTCMRDGRLPPADPKVAAALPAIIEDGCTWELTEQEQGDLDLFSPPVGVFGLLNRTSTIIGARRLAGTLKRPLLEPDRIRRRQEAVAHLTASPETRLALLATCALLRKEDRRLTGLIRAIDQARPLRLFANPAVLRFWSYVTLAFSLAALLLTLLGQFTWGGVWLAVLAVNGLIYMRIRGAIVEAFEPWRDVAWAAEGYLQIARIAAAQLPYETDLDELRRRFEAVVPDDVLGSLPRRLGWAESGGMLQVLLNLVMLCDLHIAHAIVDRVLANRAKLLEGLAALAELELLLSLAAFGWEQPVTCTPQPVERTTLQITRGRHPLVDPESVVPNGVRLDCDTRLWIVTGSNMAGKSTLLRMAGVNTLLAQIGCAATAEQMRWTPLRLMTDLSATDNLAQHESYFLAEVRHLRRMILPPAGAAPLLGLIDEPFRGTNSQDQTAASIAVTHHLLASGHLFLLATHDRRLTTLADDRSARNFHFRENLGREGMVFDYLLHPGPATTRNALRILEREGYPPELIERAQEWAARLAGDADTASAASRAGRGST